MTFLRSLNIMQCWGPSRTPVNQCFPDILLGRGEEARQWSANVAANSPALLVTLAESCKQGIYHRATLWLLSAEKAEQVARGVLYCLDNWGEHEQKKPFIFEDRIPPLEEKKRGNLLFPAGLSFGLNGSQFTSLKCFWIAFNPAYMFPNKELLGNVSASMRPCVHFWPS